jgi:amino acid transporter
MEHKLSLSQAILINVNILLGAGIFINTIELAKKAGPLGFAAYGIIGLLLFPLIWSMARLVARYPEGGFYTFGKQGLNTLAGFISSWSYFIGKLASAVLMIHASILLLQQIILPIQHIPAVWLDSAALLLYMALNLLHKQTGATIQKWFLILKLIPLLFVIGVGYFLLNPQNFLVVPHDIYGLTNTLPLVLYATIGFEATCSICHNLKNAATNGPIAMFASYTIVICIALLYQFFFYMATGPLLELQTNYLNAFPLLLHALTSSPLIIGKVTILLNLALASSALGGAYGILYTNVWNVVTLAKNNHLYASKTLVQLNAYRMPLYAIALEGLICFGYLFITNGSQLPLQQTGALGVTIAYTISALALLALQWKSRKRSSIVVPLLALISCSLLIESCLHSFFLNTGIVSLATFLILLIGGIIMFFFKT